MVKLGVLRDDEAIVSKPSGTGGGDWLISFELEKDDVCSMLLLRGGADCVNC